MTEQCEDTKYKRSEKNFIKVPRYEKKKKLSSEIMPWRALTLLQNLADLRSDFNMVIYRSMSDLRLKAYVIARSSNLTSSKMQFLEDCGLKVVRVDPVFTTETSENMTNREYGCYLAHKHVWEQIVQENGAGAVVFEEDFEPVVDVEIVKQALQDFQNDNSQLVKLGNCGNYCTHAYILSNKMAQSLLDLKPEPSDHLFLKIPEKKVVSHANVPKYFGEGFFQQNRAEQDDTAIHNFDNIRHDLIPEKNIT